MMKIKMQQANFVTTERRNYLESEPNCYATKFFIENRNEKDSDTYE